jgi:UDP-N-acetylmuramyl pentapeptide phosphotransferase/UDP-N-acetylglucosamine-1-phosphate transferase
MFDMYLTSIFLSGYIASISILLVIVLSAELHIGWTSGPKDAIQKVHDGEIPRIGGLAVFLGILASVVVVGQKMSNFPIILSSTIALGMIFLIGFMEDLSGIFSVFWRLLLSFIPGIFIALDAGIYLSHMGLELFDPLLTIQFLAISFTAFALSGVSHAFNMIDGLNGLVGFSSLWMLGAYLALGFHYEDYLIVELSLILGAPILGFLSFNWPRGKCFLGDGGAYLIGFFLGLIGVLLVERNSLVSSFAPLLICGYPIIEALYSISRRLHRRVNTGAPDNLHLHQLVKFKLIRPWFLNYGASAMAINSATGFLLSIVWVPFIVLAVWFNNRQNFLIGIFLLEFLLYCALYFVLNKIKVRVT